MSGQGEGSVGDQGQGSVGTGPLGPGSTLSPRRQSSDPQRSHCNLGACLFLCPQQEEKQALKQQLQWENQLGSQSQARVGSGTGLQGSQCFEHIPGGMEGRESWAGPRLSPSLSFGVGKVGLWKGACRGGPRPGRSPSSGRPGNSSVPLLCRQSWVLHPGVGSRGNPWPGGRQLPGGGETTDVPGGAGPTQRDSRALGPGAPLPKPDLPRSPGLAHLGTPEVSPWGVALGVPSLLPPVSGPDGWAWAH